MLSRFAKACSSIKNILSTDGCYEFGQGILIMIVDFVFIQNCFAFKSYFRINLYIFFYLNMLSRFAKTFQFI
jgi:hypothetical protein